MTTLTQQQVFDFVINHLRTQKEQAFDPQVKYCMYRAPDGKRCAVGSLIPDDRYNSALEGMPFDVLIAHAPNLFDGLFELTDEMSTMLGDLQDLHDSARVASVHGDYERFEGRTFEREVRRVADYHGLSYTPPV